MHHGADGARIDEGGSDWRDEAMVRVGGAWVAGLMLGNWAHWPAAVSITVAAGMLVVGVAAWRLRRPRIATAVSLLAVAAIAAGWWVIRAPRMDFQPPADNLLVDVEGVIEGEPRPRFEAPGALGQFDYRSPRTYFTMKVDVWHGADGPRPMNEAVLVGVPNFDGRLRGGDRVRLQGWMTPLQPPRNPGERDFATIMREQGVTARITLKSRGNWRLVEPGDDPAGKTSSLLERLAQWRQAARSAASAALHRDMERRVEPESMALLDTILLGERGGDLGDLEGAFRRVGLSHLLAISGLHLSILAAGAWWAVQLLTGRPRWAARAALTLVVLYVLLVPPMVPILRAGFMTSVCIVALSRGRRVSPMSVMAAIAVILLLWRPGDLFTAGFQLSFGIVAALLIFTKPVARWIVPPPPIPDADQTAGPTRRIAVDYAAVTIIAWLTSLPLVAYHFQLVSPMAILVGLAMMPIITVLLWAGYVKIAVTWLWPAAGSIVGSVLGVVCELFAGMVRGASSARGAAIEVPAPSAWWAAATMLFVILLLGGWFGTPRRRWAGLAAAVVLGCWLIPPVSLIAWAAPAAHRPVLRLHMLAVGNGSCYLVQSRGEAIVFDCGSSNHLDITTSTVGPALRALGVRRVDTLILSHPDADHFSGSLELIDQFNVGRVLLTRYFLEEADRADADRSAAAFVVAGIRQRGVAIEQVSRGWNGSVGEVSLTMLWPPNDAEFARNNDGSIVLRIDAAGRRLMLCGDIQQQALAMMLDEPLDVKADVVELPHHGSFVAGSTRWLSAVSPSIVLQSSGEARLRYDPWPPHLGNAKRYVTARHGAVEVAVRPDGAIDVEPFVESADEPTR